jgi:hypothetical protein
MAHDVFISYSSNDKLKADAVCAGLESAGIRCWIAPRDILPSASYAGSIMEAIRTSRVMVVIFSSHSNKSPHVQREVERAIGHRLAIVPFRIEGVAPSEGMEYFLGVPHWLDAITPPLNAHIHRLEAAVRALLGVAQPEAPPVEPQGRGTPEIDFDRIGERPGSLWSAIKNRLLGDG